MNYTSRPINGSFYYFEPVNSSHTLDTLNIKDDGRLRAKILNGPIQAIALVVLITIAVTINGLVIGNIRKNVIKTRIVTFVLIQYMCALDMLGAITTLPFPFYVSLFGEWTLGSTICSMNAVMNAGVCFQHFMLFIMLKIDRALASCLPIGNYPVIPVNYLQLIVLISTVASFSLAITIILEFGSKFHQVILLCTPNFSHTVYISLLAIYTCIMSTCTFCYLCLIICLKLKQRQKQRKIYCFNSVQTKDYRNNIHAACISFNITVTNLIVYFPTMFLLGQHHLQDVLPKFVFLIVDIIFYTEFFSHSLILLILSSKLRKEIKLSISSFIAKISR